MQFEACRRQDVVRMIVYADEEKLRWETYWTVKDLKKLKLRFSIEYRHHAKCDRNFYKSETNFSVGLIVAH